MVKRKTSRFSKKLEQSDDLSSLGSASIASKQPTSLFSGRLKESDGGLFTLHSNSKDSDDVDLTGGIVDVDMNQNSANGDVAESAHPFDKFSDEVENGNGTRRAGKRPTQPPQQELEPISESSFTRRKSSATKIDFLKDPPSTMTYGRRIALSLMSKKWYNPGLKEDEEEKAKRKESIAETMHRRQREEEEAARRLEKNEPEPEVDLDEEKPNLAKAWAYFEHVTLSRHLVEPKPEGYRKKNIIYRAFNKVFCKADKKLERAEPNENEFPSKLYSPLFTPHKQLGDFGLGIGLYFSTLRALAFIALLAGLANIPLIRYYNSDEYLPPSERHRVPTLLQGSAICTQTEWVPCIDCDCDNTDQWARPWDPMRGRCGFVEINGTRTDTVLAERNLCEGVTSTNIITNYFTMIGVLVMTLLLGLYLRNQEIAFDEDEQTAQDYSILIKNPPPDATDPEEWRRFFRDACGARVTVCTIAVDNDLLVQTLVERREKIQAIKANLGTNHKLDLLDLAKRAAKKERERSRTAAFIAMILPDIPELFGRLVALNSKVQGLAQLDYPATRVFISFETERDQRAVLSQMTVGAKQAKANDTTCLDRKFLFRGEKVLRLFEPDEPNTIRWQDLNAPFLAKFKQQALTTLCNLVAIVVIAFIITVANVFSSLGAAIAIALGNSIFPEFAKILVSFEQHSSEGTKQTSLYVKIAAFRWVNTAIIISIITPFTDTLASNKGLIEQIYTLFFAEIVTTNLIQLLEPMGHLKRHFLAPRAPTQDAMNLCFLGYEFELAERYTNMTKILFLTLWYCSIYPAAFFMCSVALFVNYYADRFSLMRTWERAPQLGTHISQFSRKYFFSLAVMAMAIMSSFFWSGFPFDNLCETDDASDVPAGEYTLVRFNGTEQRTVSTTAAVAEGVNDFKYCRQNFLRMKGVFPFVASRQPEGLEWMTDEQETWTTIYGWSAVGVMGVVAASFVIEWIKGILNARKNSYEAVGEDQNIPFSEVPSINAYIPQVTSLRFAYPLLACNIEGLDDELFDWNNPDRPHSYYDLTNDADELLNGMDMSSNNGFSFIKHWPPNKTDSLGSQPTASSKAEFANGIIG